MYKLHNPNSEATEVCDPTPTFFKSQHYSNKITKIRILLLDLEYVYVYTGLKDNFSEG